MVSSRYTFANFDARKVKVALSSEGQDLGSNPLRRAVFLDRDGVLNELVAYGSGHRRSPRSLSELRFTVGAREAVKQVARAGFFPIIVTNQPDVAHGSLASPVLAEMHFAFRRFFPDLKGVYVCEHMGNVCSCRKPQPGMLLQAAQDLDLDLAGSWMIGDRWVDIAAAHAAGCRSVLISLPYSWAPNSSGAPDRELRPTLVATDVLDAVRRILDDKHSFGHKNS